MRIIASSDEFSLEQDFNSPFVAIVDGEDTIRCVLPYDVLYDLAKQIVDNQ
jgi:hypothetical protein